jgi:hypothetical protein
LRARISRDSLSPSGVFTVVKYTIFTRCSGPSFSEARHASRLSQACSICDARSPTDGHQALPVKRSAAPAIEARREADHCRPRRRQT